LIDEHNLKVYKRVLTKTEQKVDKEGMRKLTISEHRNIYVKVEVTNQVIMNSNLRLYEIMTRELYIIASCDL
jgi:regulator of sigma D